MNVVTTYFIVKRLAGSVFIGENSLKHRDVRQQEYIDCLGYNCAHPGVETVHLLVEGAEAYQHLMTSTLPAMERAERAKILPILHGGPGMPVYADLFSYANRLLPGRLSMICNADVHLSKLSFSLADVQALFAAFDEKHSQITSSSSSSSSMLTYGSTHTAPLDGRECSRVTRPTRLALALTRHESDNDGDAPFIMDYRGSHDAFIVRPPLPDTFIRSVTHPQNCYKAENVVIHELRQSGHMVLNPCLDMRLVHRHEADVRQWFPPVDEERYGRSAPVSLQEAHDMIARW